MIKRLFQTLLALAGFAVLGAGLWLLSGGSFDKSGRESLPPEPPANAPPGTVTVTLAPVVRRPVQRSVDASGTLFGYEEVAVASKVEGRVLKILRDVSERVNPGEILLEIDPTDADLNARQAEQSLQVELSRLGLKEPPAGEFDVAKLPAVVQAAIRLENARAKVLRADRGGAAISTEEAAERRIEKRLAEAEYDNQVLLAQSSLATIRLKAEALALAKQQLRDTAVRVPLPTQPLPGGDSTGGTYAIGRRSVAEGSYVRAGAEVFRIVIDRSLKLRVAVPERFGGRVELGQRADVFSAAYATPFAGTVARINPTVDAATRTFEVEILVPNSDRQLKAGGFAKASILTRRDASAATVPLEAVVNFAGVNKVFLAADGRVKEVPVVLGAQSTEWIEIVKPALPAGAIVVTSGQSALANGTEIQERVTEAKKPDAGEKK